MKKKTIKVPTDVQFISDWTEYTIPKGRCIVDKGVTGCGYTEFCLRNDLNIVLCSPRKLLLENKEEQHKNDQNILYLRNEVGNKDSLSVIENMCSSHIRNARYKKKPAKFMVTYDSAHFIISYLLKNKLENDFYVIADEFQSIFLDSYFKADVENDFVNTVSQCSNVVYLSATPMLTKYLVQIDQFKNLDYYELDWSDSNYIENVQIQRRQTKSLGAEINKIIQDYLKGNFPIIVKSDKSVVESKEAVFYFNSVKGIKKAIEANNLGPKQVNVLCADNAYNRRELRKLRVKIPIGKIPLKGEPHKMFTFCTSTSYVGADFYSTCASTFVFADPNLRSLALDVSLDLPQIAGRQRNRSNPFKNIITVFYKITRNENLEDREQFDKLQEKRERKTQILLEDYERVKNDDERRTVQLENIDSRTHQLRYSLDFVSFSWVNGKQVPVRNELIRIAHERAWEISQKDYQDAISVTRAIDSLRIVDGISKEYMDNDDKIISDFLSNKFYSTKVFEDRLREFCKFMDSYKDNKYITCIINHKIPDLRYRNFYAFFGTPGCRSFRYMEGTLTKEMFRRLTTQNTLDNQIFMTFTVGEKYSKKEIKKHLKSIYTSLKIPGNPKASDLEKWFEIKPCKILDKTSGKRYDGFEIIRKK